MNNRSISILENNRAMMAIVGEKKCSGVPKYRSSIYTPDPRYDCGRGATGCGMGNLYIPSEEIFNCQRRMPNMHLYNMPKKGGNLRLINTSRDTKNEISCITRNPSLDYDIGSMYPHRNRETLHCNLKETGCSSCVHEISAISRTSFKCMDCGCKYTQRKESQCNCISQCSLPQGSTNPVVVQVTCVPESTTSADVNGQTYLFRFNIQQQSNRTEKEPCDRNSNFSSSVWWNCNLPDCDCQNKNSAQRESFTGNQTICTIPGKDGQPVPITCHYCFNLDEINNNDQARLSNGSNACNRPRNTQKSLHGGSCICAMCERLRSETRKRPNYYKAPRNNNGCNGYMNNYKSSKNGTNRFNPDHGPLCSCTDHQKCLNNFSSLNSQFGIHCRSLGEDNNNCTNDPENNCLCLCHNVAPDNWELDMEENERSCCEGQIEDDKCTQSTPPVLVRTCVSNGSRC